MNGLKKKKEKMRDIKFRYVTQNRKNKNDYHLTYISLKALEINNFGIQRENRNDNWNLIAIDEYTGLKDKNNKPIYENDIIRTYIEDDCVNTKVFFAGAGFCIENEEKNYAPFLEEFYDLRFLKIIGNVYENSESLK